MSENPVFISVLTSRGGGCTAVAAGFWTAPWSEVLEVYRKF